MRSILVSFTAGLLVLACGSGSKFTGADTTQRGASPSGTGSDGDRGGGSSGADGGGAGRSAGSGGGAGGTSGSAGGGAAGAAGAAGGGAAAGDGAGDGAGGRGSDGPGSSDGSAATGGAGRTGDGATVTDGDLSLPPAQRCWFAVSGATAGTSYYHGVFGATFSNKPIGPGEIFDTVGGIYLAVRDEPYVKGEGGRELDLAIKWTFDSIVIPPGVTAIIKNAGGTVLFDGAGPFVAISDYYVVQAGATYLTALQSNTLIPKWLKAHVQTLTHMPSVTQLHDGVYVKVSAVKGGPCDL